MVKLTGIAALQPATRRAAADREIAAARVMADTVDVTYHPSRFEPSRMIHAKVLDTSDALDSNGRDNLVIRRASSGDAGRDHLRVVPADLSLLTIGLHMVVSIAPHSEASND
ncbi:hypothetical protein OG474_30160 [Kribbella sp. NBC_01505]|uniref:hypothetical protein n=1 Tax=Kribbella sp. NBC_01505 TaxID=2903580 RepID=UPI0038645D49